MIPGENAVDGDVICTSILQQITIENQSKYVNNCVSWFPFNENFKFPEFVIMCHILMPQCSKHLLREILPVNHIFGLQILHTISYIPVEQNVFAI